MSKVQRVENPILAYENIPFLKSDICRPIRLELEYLHPDEVMKYHHVDSTVVIFGSARIMSPEEEAEALAKADEELQKNPEDESLRRKYEEVQRFAQYTKFYQVARELSYLISHSANQGKTNALVVTGGGPGIMEAGNRGAQEAGSPSVALNINLPFEQFPNEYVTEKLCFNFHYFSVRKMHFLKRAKALCAFPGGFGTLDELFEALTLIQTEKIGRLPVVLFGKEFWQSLVNWQVLVDTGMISAEDLSLFRFYDTAEEAWDYIRCYWDQACDLETDPDFI